MTDRFDEMAEEIARDVVAMAAGSRERIAAALRSVAAPPPALTEERIAEMARGFAGSHREEDPRLHDVLVALLAEFGHEVAAATQTANAAIVAEAVRRSEERVDRLRRALEMAANYVENAADIIRDDELSFDEEDDADVRDSVAKWRALAKEPTPGPVVTTERVLSLLADTRARLTVRVSVDGHPCGEVMVASGPRQTIEDYANGAIDWSELERQQSGGRRALAKEPSR